MRRYSLARNSMKWFIGRSFATPRASETRTLGWAGTEIKWAVR